MGMEGKDVYCLFVMQHHILLRLRSPVRESVCVIVPSVRTGTEGYHSHRPAVDLTETTQTPSLRVHDIVFFQDI